MAIWGGKKKTKRRRFSSLPPSLLLAFFVNQLLQPRLLVSTASRHTHNSSLPLPSLHIRLSLVHRLSEPAICPHPHHTAQHSSLSAATSQPQAPRPPSLHLSFPCKASPANSFGAHFHNRKFHASLLHFNNFLPLTDHSMHYSSLGQKNPRDSSRSGLIMPVSRPFRFPEFLVAKNGRHNAIRMPT